MKLEEFNTKEIKERIIKAGYAAIEDLIKIAEEEIIIEDDDEEGEEVEESLAYRKIKALAADKLKNAAATKKLAIFDAFEILNRIENEKDDLQEESEFNQKKKPKDVGFAESRAK